MMLICLFPESEKYLRTCPNYPQKSNIRPICKETCRTTWRAGKTVKQSQVLLLCLLRVFTFIGSDCCSQRRDVPNPWPRERRMGNKQDQSGPKQRISHRTLRRQNMQSIKYLRTADASKYRSNQCNVANDSNNNTFQIVQPPYFSVLLNLVTPGRLLWMQFYFITDQLSKV